jgi:hypothetical protein
MVVSSQSHPHRTQAEGGRRPGDAVSGETQADDERVAARPRRVFVRVVLVSAMILATLNVWTGGPLFALWVGSKVQGSFTTLKMGAVGVAVLTLAVVSLVLVRVIHLLDIRYGEVTGRPPRTRQPLPWLRSMRDKYGDPPPEREPLTALERIVVTMVVIAFACLEVWFFFFAGSSLPNS